LAAARNATVIEHPDHIALMPPGASLRWRGYPFMLVLIPEGRDAASVQNEPGVRAVYVIEPDTADEALNSRTLEAYLACKAPVRVCACRACDLRPFLRQAEALRARGYLLEVVR
jgi:hypothetical protein